MIFDFDCDTQILFDFWTYPNDTFESLNSLLGNKVVHIWHVHVMVKSNT